MVARTRTCAILHLSVCMPHRFLAGKCDQLSTPQNNWCVASMNLVADAIDNAMLEIQKDSTKFVDETFMMGIFDAFKHLQPFDEWWEYTFVCGRKSNTVGNTKKEGRMFVMEHLLKDAFRPEQDCNKETEEVVKNLGFEAAVTMHADMHDKTKATAANLTIGGGKFCWENISDKEREAGKGKKAVNDPAESIFARVKNEVLKFGMVSFAHAAGVSQSKMNGDFTRVFSGDDETDLGYFHRQSKEMQSAILILAEEKLKDVGCYYRNVLKSSHEHRTMMHDEEREKHQKILEKKSRGEIRLHRMLGTKNVWMIESEVDAALANFCSNTHKLDAVKDQ